MKRRFIQSAFATLLLVSGFLVTISAPTQAAKQTSAPAWCPVTQGNGVHPPDTKSWPGDYGNEALWTNLHMWSDDGTVPVPDTDWHVWENGEMGLKWAWYRFVPGKLTVEGRRLDAPALPARGEVNDAYGSIGFQPIALVFPSGGCWEVTGRIGDKSLTFVTYVIPPPSWVPRANFWQ